MAYHCAGGRSWGVSGSIAIWHIIVPEVECMPRVLEARVDRTDVMSTPPTETSALPPEYTDIKSSIPFTMTKSVHRQQQEEKARRHLEDCARIVSTASSTDGSDVTVLIKEAEKEMVEIIKHTHHTGAANCVRVKVFGQIGAHRFPYHTIWCPNCDTASIKAELTTMLNHNSSFLTTFGKFHLENLMMHKRSIDTYDVALNSDIEKIREMIPAMIQCGGNIRLKTTFVAEEWAAWAFVGIASAFGTACCVLLTELSPSNLFLFLFGIIVARVF
ncbi:hypothetical protein DFP73DRAFT_632177 [Morchella snyderi]|nr:hypothetical protein DFP73DRAFT_632177 [Morchella snyderi]